jgi:hypothetical protein
LEAETVSEKLEFNYTVMLVVGKRKFIAFGRREAFKLYISDHKHE